MNNILRDLRTALNNIDEKYYEMENVSFNNGILEFDTKEDQKNYERRFMIEFSVQYSKLFNTNTNKIYRGTQTDFEIPKRYMYSEKSDKDILKTFEKINNKEQKNNLNSEVMFKYFTTIPDFLIHKTQNNIDEKYQKLIVEAKTNPNSSKIEIFKDIFHINIYAEKYNYQNSVIILINYPKKKWLKDFRSYLANSYYLASKEKQDKIFVVFKENFESEITINSLKDLKIICQQNV